MHISIGLPKMATKGILSLTQNDDYVFIRNLSFPIGEPGLMLLRITQTLPFEGYLGNKETNEKKLVRNVKKNGDVFFNTGDLMMIDQDGYVYFKDRLGDTFR